MNKKITLVGWHLGDLDTIGQAAFRAFDDADVILLETDPSMPNKLPWSDGYNPGEALLRNVDKIKSYYYYEKTNFGEILDSYNNIVVLASAGMPGIQNPGATIINAAEARKEISIDLIPGPSALTSAIALSGFNTFRFIFGGMLRIGETEQERTETISAMQKTGLTTVFFVQDFNVVGALQDLISAYPSTTNAAVIANVSRPGMVVKRGSLLDIFEDLEFISKVDGSTSRSRLAVVVEGSW